MGECSCLEHKMKIFGNVVVGPKGQIVIPKEVRDLLDIHPGDSLVITTKYDVAMGVIKGSNVEKFMDYMRSELDNISSKISNQ